MGRSLAQKIFEEHLVSGSLEPGSDLAIRIDQTLTQDSTGTMAYLQLEAMNVDQVKTDFSIAYVDHNMLQQGFENADDHKYIQTVAKKHGVHYSRPGNGICHQVHLERYAKPGGTLLGSDSHTPTAGGIGMIAIGAGGLDVAAAMGGQPYTIPAPNVMAVELTGQLSAFTTAKDVILEVLRRLTVKGGVGRILEYIGDGVQSLSVPERATITNMGAELGATTSIFPSDHRTRSFLKAQGREADWVELLPDADAQYAERIVVDLSGIEPLAAQPHSPDAVDSVANIGSIKVDQVAIGSCTNSSYQDLMRVAAILKGKTVHEDVSLVLSPGSKQVLSMLAANGALADLIQAGARILESGCGPCIGMGQAPATDAISLRTFNRNFKGRCGTDSASVYLVSPETAAVSALSGVLTDPREWGVPIAVAEPEQFPAEDNLVVPPAAPDDDVQVVRGPNIKEFPLNTDLPEQWEGVVLLKVGDNITTDDIMPSNAKLLPFRSNIPHLSEFCFAPVDAEFPRRAKQAGGGFIIGGDNYGQGSSREHAALVPLYLGIKAVVAKSFARIHRANLINSGIVPLEFEQPDDYEWLKEGDAIVVESLHEAVQSGDPIAVRVPNRDGQFMVRCALSPREQQMIMAGGRINVIRQSQKGDA